MRTIDCLKACAFAGAFVLAAGAAPAYAAIRCAELNASTTLHPATFGPFSVSLNAGDTVVLNDATLFGVTDTLTVGSSSSSFTMPGTTSITVTTSGTYTVSAAIGISPIIGLATLSCRPGPTGSSSEQSTNNAQIAVSNGLRTLQNYQEWVTKGILGSFGMTRGGDTASARPLTREPSARDKAEALARKERELSEELAALPPGDERAADITDSLVRVRRNLAFARVTADIAKLDGSRSGASQAGPGGNQANEFSIRSATSPRDVAGAPPRFEDTGSLPQTATAPSVSLDACDFSACDPNDPLGRKWNVWAEGRIASLNDSLAQTNTLGFAGAAGVDYKFQPWLALGMSVGVESYETGFGVPGVRTGTIGVSLVPYFGMRLHPNIYAEGFVGVTKLNYNLTPAVGVSGGFDAWRVFLGGALSGVWHDGNWRFQPSILGAYGSETQNAYTDSAGTAVPAQTITFGRIAAGPEIGYTFKDESRGWSFEPFVLLKGNIDFSSAPVYAIGGTPYVVRSGAQGSGQLGGGLAMQLDDGFYLRVQASYDSFFVSGLDAWSGRIRAGKTF
jgi:hypothetical protein